MLGATVDLPSHGRIGLDRLNPEEVKESSKVFLFVGSEISIGCI